MSDFLPVPASIANTDLDAGKLQHELLCASHLSPSRRVRVSIRFRARKSCAQRRRRSGTSQGHVRSASGSSMQASSSNSCLCTMFLSHISRLISRLQKVRPMTSSSARRVRARVTTDLGSPSEQSELHCAVAFRSGSTTRGAHRRDDSVLACSDPPCPPRRIAGKMGIPGRSVMPRL